MIEERSDSGAFQHLTDDLLGRGTGFRFHARGRSMLPTIQDGQVLHVEPVNSAKLDIGDIVLLRSQGSFKAHRIVRKQGAHFVTQGDASLDPDGEFSSSQILGRVVAKEHPVTGSLTSLAGMRCRLIFFAREVRKRAAHFLHF